MLTHIELFSYTFFFWLQEPNAENPQIWKSLVQRFHGMCPIPYSTLPYELENKVMCTTTYSYMINL